MECDLDKLSAYLDGELSERESARLEAHLADCGRCRAELDALRKLDRLLDRVEPVEAPEGFESKLDARLERRRDRIVRIDRLRSARRILAAVAASVVLVAGWIIFVQFTSTSVVKPEARVAAHSADAPVALTEQDLAALDHIEVIEDLDLLQDLQVAIALNDLPEMTSLNEK